MKRKVLIGIIAAFVCVIMIYSIVCAPCKVGFTSSLEHGFPDRPYISGTGSIKGYSIIPTTYELDVYAQIISTGTQSRGYYKIEAKKFKYDLGIKKGSCLLYVDENKKDLPDIDNDCCPEIHVGPFGSRRFSFESMPR